MNSIKSNCFKLSNGSSNSCSEDRAKFFLGQAEEDQQQQTNNSSHRSQNNITNNSNQLQDPRLNLDMTNNNCLKSSTPPHTKAIPPHLQSTNSTTTNNAVHINNINQNKHTSHHHHQQQQQQQQQQMVAHNNDPSILTNDYPLINGSNPTSCSEYENEVQIQKSALRFSQLDIHNDPHHNSNHQQKQQKQKQKQKQQQQQQQAMYMSGKHTEEPCRDIEKSKKLLADGSFDKSNLKDDELIDLVNRKIIPTHKLEAYIRNADRSVRVRRLYFEQKLCKDDKGRRERAEGIKNLPYENFDYDRVVGACCENVIGYVQLPVGVAGPLILNGEEIFVPMATTEGCLVASTTRGFSALSKSGGVKSHVAKNFMTRAPCVKFENFEERTRAFDWLHDPDHVARLTQAFNSTSNFAKLIGYDVRRVSKLLYIRFMASTGDAMGMNMLSKGTEKALEEMKREFPTMEVVSLSSNYCTDKKPAAVNWINGRGKDVQCEAVLPAEIVQTILKVSVEKMVDLWRDKVMIGSALAGSIGGFNSQAANIVTALYIACGQDPAQNVTSSNCIITMEQNRYNGALEVTCTMPSIECGTVGGGTILPAQSAALQMMGIKGPSRPPLEPGKNAEKFAEIVCASVLAGELSLLAALAEGTLVRSHMRHNRSSLNVLNAAQKQTSAAPSE